jgi:ribosome-binding factor A
MPKHPERVSRIAEQIQRDLSGIIRSELKDPRVGMVTITDVEVAHDYAHAKIFFTVMGNKSDPAQCTEGLTRAAGFLRSELGKGMSLRVVPQLHFVYDTSIERGVHLSNLIDKANAGNKNSSEE